MLIGYANRTLRKVCTERKAARKALPQRSAEMVLRRLTQLAAFDNLGQIPFRAPPLDFHPLRGDFAGQFAVKLRSLDRVVFRPVGSYGTCEDGSLDLSTVTEIEITYVGDYHGDG